MQSIKARLLFVIILFYSMLFSGILSKITKLNVKQQNRIFIKFIFNRNIGLYSEHLQIYHGFNTHVYSSVHIKVVYNKGCILCTVYTQPRLGKLEVAHALIADD